MFEITRRVLGLMLLMTVPAVSSSPEEFAAYVRKDHAMYEPIVKASGTKIE